MKENNVRSFENYQKMLDESKNKSKILSENNESTKIPNTVNNSNTSSKKPSSKQKLQRASRTSKKSPTKAHSPNRHKNNTHSPVKAVSYAELQLILQNIDMIKSKAKHQIEVLEMKNKELIDEIETSREKYQKNQKAVIEIEKQRNKISEKYENFQKNYQQRWHEVQLRERIWIEEKQQYVQEILNFKESNRLDLTTISQLQQNLEKQSSQKEEWRSKYESLASILTAKKSERITELIYQMKENFSGRAILDVLSQREKTILVLEKEIERIESEKNKLQQLLSEQKQHKAKNSDIVDRLMTENKALLEAISMKEQEYKNSLNSMKQEAQNNRQTNIRLSQQLHQLQNEYEKKLSEIQSLKNTIASLNNKMETQLTHMQEITSSAEQQKMNRKYFDVVDEECEQLEDISRVLAKMEVLQKSKIQNRLNVEKIQFLCKMLDS